MKSFPFKKVISFGLFAGIVVWIIWFIKNHWQDFTAIETIVWPYIIILLIIAFLYIIIQGLVLKVTLEPFDIRLKFS